MQDACGERSMTLLIMSKKKIYIIIAVFIVVLGVLLYLGQKRLLPNKEHAKEIDSFLVSFKCQGPGFLGMRVDSLNQQSAE